MNNLPIVYSFIIPTRGDNEKITRCIGSINQAIDLDNNKYCVEILIINTGDAEEIIYPNINLSKVLIKTINNADKNVCIARNVGIHRSQGEYSILIDDDAFIDQAFFINLHKYVRDKKLNCICGKLINPKTMTTITKKENRIKYKYLNKYNFNLFRGTCIIIKKSIIESVGKYDDKYGPGGIYFSAEESDLFFRLKRNKIDILFVHDVIFYHPVEELTSKTKIYYYSYATGILLLNQMKADKRSAPLYLYWLIRITLVCIIRLFQLMMDHRRINPRDKKSHYLYVLKGISCAFIKFFRRNSVILSEHRDCDKNWVRNKE